jgi:hypothetical protein
MNTKLCGKHEVVQNFFQSNLLQKLLLSHSGMVKTQTLKYTERMSFQKGFTLMLEIGHAIDNGIVLSMKMDELQVFINKTLSILSAYQ